MALFDLFRKKEKQKPKREKAVKEKEEKPVQKEKKKESVKIEPIKRKKTIGNAYKVLHSPHITEKATRIGENNKYTFKVLRQTNKIEIKKAIEGVYGVDVEDVKIINIPRKKRRLGRHIGWKSGYKKAIVKIKASQKIEILPR